MKSFTFTILSFLWAYGASAQQIFSVKGEVHDAPGGRPIVGATVVLKEQNVSTSTDSFGRFELKIKEDILPFYLTLTAIGYSAKEIRITEKEQLEHIVVDLQPLEYYTQEVVVTARRRSEVAQDIPIPISVISGAQIQKTGSFNVNLLKEYIPSVQLYASNGRNTTLNIRGLGSTYGLTNDGIEPGVGFYIDGVYHSRPAATAADFIDVERIEVLRGPQGTLFGKNTTAGAFNITTKKASFEPGATFESSFGNYGLVQAKASVTGPLIKNTLAARFSFSGTQRNGTVYNTATQKYINDLNNLGVRGQLLFLAGKHVSVTLAGDFTRQRPEGYAQVVAGVVKTQRAGYRQFDSIIADLNYRLPSRDPFERKVDNNTSWRSDNDLGGAALNVDAKIGNGSLTSTTAWRYWRWDPSNDRDFTGLPVLTRSQAPSVHNQWSQEVRYGGEVFRNLSGVVGLYLLGQELKSNPVQTEEAGSAQWRFAQSSRSNLWATPGLFDGFGTRTAFALDALSAAAFTQLDLKLTEQLHLLAGLRYNRDTKDATYRREAYGGLQTNDSALNALKRSVYTSQSFDAQVDNTNWSWLATLNYRLHHKANAYLTYSTAYKPVGVNIGGLPVASGEVLVNLAEVKPEYVNHVELGIKSSPIAGATLNVTLYNTDIKDYQTLVQTPDPAINRGYLSNAEKVRVSGAELDGGIRFNEHILLRGSFAYTDGKYVSFTNAPVPLEETGSSIAYKDVSGGELPGISKYAASLGVELSTAGSLINLEGRFSLGVDGFYRSGFSSSPSPSKYLNIDGYELLNARATFAANNGISFSIWGRNILNRNYFEQLLPASGGSGLYVGVLGDPRTYGVTVLYNLR